MVSLISSPLCFAHSEVEFSNILLYICVYSCWPLNESEAGVDLVLIETCLFSLCAVLMLIIGNLHKSSEVSIKARSTPASLLFKDQATNHTTVKWYIDFLLLLFCLFVWPSINPTNILHGKHQVATPALDKTRGF